MVQWGDRGMSEADLQSVLLRATRGIPMMRTATRNPGPLRTRPGTDRQREQRQSRKQGAQEGRNRRRESLLPKRGKTKGKGEGKTKGKIVRQCEGSIDPIHPRGQSPTTFETTARKDSRA